ncbi:MAG: hypothetical protein QXL94_01065 [Candidatus Parvarchaeum sp.]
MTSIFLGYNLKLGNGLSFNTSTDLLSNTGVLSLQGDTGALNLTAGTGISISGLTITNTGIISLSAGTGISVSGNTITNTGVTSLQGEVGALSLTAGSGISISGLTITNSAPNVDYPAQANTWTGTQIFNSIGMASNTSGNTIQFGGNVWDGAAPGGTGNYFGIQVDGGSSSQLMTISSNPGQLSINNDGSIFVGDGGFSYNPFGTEVESDGDILANGNIAGGGNLGINGSATINNSLTVGGNLNANGGLTVHSNLTVDTSATFNDPVALNSNVTIADIYFINSGTYGGGSSRGGISDTYFATTLIGAVVLNAGYNFTNNSQKDMLVYLSSTANNVVGNPGDSSGWTPMSVGYSTWGILQSGGYIRFNSYTMNYIWFIIS